MAVTYAAKPAPTPTASATEAPGTPVRSDRRRARLTSRSAALGHWLAGWRDGRGHRPVIGEDAPLPVRLHVIAAQAQAAAEGRWIELIEATREQRIMLAGLPDEIDRAINRRDRAVSELTQLIATGPDFTRRYGEAHMPPSLVRSRRVRDHEKRIDELTDARDKRTNYVHMKRAQEHELRQELTVALDAAQSGTRADFAHFDALAATYLRGALRTHPDPVACERQYGGFEVPRPAWVRLNSVDDLLRAAGAESDQP